MITRKKHNKYYGRTLFFATIFSTIVYMIWRVFFTVPLGEGYISLFFGLGLLIVEFIGMLEAFEHYYNMSDILTIEKQQPPVDWYPHVDVFIATYNEPAELLEKTINGCLNMDYPDKSKVHIYVCDDNRREKIQALAEKMGVNYLKRKDNRHAKAGNYNHALAVTSSPLIATFDADMIPLRGFLMTCIPYFYAEEVVREQRKQNKNIPELKIGFIQSPQCFYNPDLFQFNLYSEKSIPDEQDYFYRDVQISRNKSNTVIYGGSNTVISRQALQDAGGFFTDVITEDFATGIMIQRKGYNCYAIDEVVATGLSPSDLKSLISQRQRWARGCIQTLRATNFLFGKGWTFVQRLGYLSSVLYWYAPIKRFFYIISPIVFSVFSIIVVKCTIQEVLLFWLPMYLFQTQTLKRLSGNIRNTRWTNVYETIMFPFLINSVIMETFGVRQKKFAVTQKDGIKQDLKRYQILRGMPHIILAILSFIGITNCIRYMFVTGSIVYLVIVFWLINNLYNLLMAIFFTLGRDIKRSSERYLAVVSCEISWEGYKVAGKTLDISERGFSTIFEHPKYIPDDSELHGSLANDRYYSSFTCRVVKVDRIKEGYRYAFRIEQPDDFANKLALYSIVYDRLPSLPSELTTSISLLDDLVTNVQRRLPQDEYANRKLPRVLVNQLFAVEGGRVRVINFNYVYILVETIDFPDAPERLAVPVHPRIVFQCTLARRNVENSTQQNHSLYRVENIKNFINLPELDSLLRQWAAEYDSEVRQDAQKQKNQGKGNVLREFDERAYI